MDRRARLMGMPAAAAITVTTRSEEQTRRLAARLAQLSENGDCILLQGDLGAGKTAFARGFIQTLYSGGEEVVSPTFTLVQTYPADSGAMLWHFDLYRLKSPDEAREIGLEEALMDGITLIEWPQKLRSELPGNALEIAIAPGSAAQERVFTFAAKDAAWQNRLISLKDETA